MHSAHHMITSQTISILTGLEVAHGFLAAAELTDAITASAVMNFMIRAECREDEEIDQRIDVIVIVNDNDILCGVCNVD